MLFNIASTYALVLVMGICVIEFSVFITNHNLRATQSVETVVCVRVCVDRRPMYAHVFIITRYIRIALFGLYIYTYNTRIYTIQCDILLRDVSYTFQGTHFQPCPNCCYLYAVSFVLNSIAPCIVIILHDVLNNELLFTMMHLNFFSIQGNLDFTSNDNFFPEFFKHFKFIY